MQSEAAARTEAGQRSEPARAWRNGADRYASLTVALHWLMLALIVAAYASIELREMYPKGSEPREALKAWHYALGISVFVLVWLRIALAVAAGSRPPVHPKPRPWQEFAATGMHLALYLLMIGMPLAGWIILNAEGDAVMFFGIRLPELVGENSEFAGLAEEIHESAGTVGYWLIGLHAAASLFHHYILRDNTLRRMLPWTH